MGPSGMLLLDVYNQPPAVGPVYNQPPAVGPVGKPSRPGPMDHPHTVDAPDWPTAGGPVAQFRPDGPQWDVIARRV